MPTHLTELVQLLVAVALLFGAASLIGHVFVYLRQPRVIGEIVGGLLLGPTFLSSILPNVRHWVFPMTGSVPLMLSVISQLGLMLLMYTSGTELRSFLQREERKVVGILTASGTLLPFIAGLAFVLARDSHDLEGPAQNRKALILVFACAIAVTSIPVISRIMLDLKILNTAFARIVLATAVIEDIILYVVLAFALGVVPVPTDARTSLPALLGLGPNSPWRSISYVLATILVFGGTLLVGPTLLRWVHRFRPWITGKYNSVLLHLLFLLTVTGLSILLGIPLLFGALASGMVAGRVAVPNGTEVREAIRRFSVAFLIPIYFATVGFRLDLIRNFNLRFFLSFLAFACVVKGSSIYLGARLAGKAHAGAVNLAVALNARGGPGIILASASLEAGIINEGFFAILVMVAVMTSLLAGSWLGRVARRGGRFL